jgi:hypothetical protein
MSTQRMTRFGRVLAAFVVVALLAAAIHAQPRGKGSVSGRILDPNGQPMPRFQLRLEQEMPIDAAPRSTVGTSGATGLQRIRIIARTATDQNGVFSFQNIDEGGYTLVGGSRQIGWVFFPFQIQPNEETKLGDIQLAR